MSRTAPAITTTLPVAPGTSVVTPMYTSVGFNAGDYVYQYGANLVGWPKGSTVGVGVGTTSIAGATYTGFVQTSDSRAVSYGPFTDTTTYSGATVTAGQTIVSPTTLSSAYAGGNTKCAVLTGGNVAYVYRTAANTITGAIYNSAGVLQGSTVTITTDCNFTSKSFSICALSDGGYIVAWLSFASGNAVYSRVNSSNTVTLSSQNVTGSNTVSVYCAATQNYYAFSFHTADGGSQAQLKIYTMSNSTTGTFTGSFTGVYNTACAGTNADTFYMGVNDTGASTFYIYHIDAGATVLGSISTISATNSYSYIAACGSTTNSTYAGNYSAWFIAANSSGQLSSVRVYASTATTPSRVITNQSVGFGIVAAASANNGDAVVTYTDSSTGHLKYMILNAGGSQTSSGTLIAGVVSSNNIGAGGFTGNKFAYGYGAAGTNYPTLQTAWGASYTTGVTVLTGATSYTPANGYYLLGVALTTAAAGATGMVATNGSANLGASYPNVTSNVLFDYTGTSFTARSAINANRGNVIGTNVTLRGLE